MKPNQICILLLLFLNIQDLCGQGRNATWCFGDSAGIQFTSSGIVGITSMMQSHEASANISDTSGNLLFYTGGSSQSIFAASWNDQNQKIANSDSVFCDISTTQGLLILPSIVSTDKFLIFSIGFNPNVSFDRWLFNSVIDMSMNNGDGQMILKNSIIDSSRFYSEKMIAIKHGNGEDWWLINHETNSDLFILRLFHKDTIFSTIYQHIGSYLNSIDSPGQMVANINGNIISIVGQAGTINVFDFDRCTGVLANFVDLSDGPFPGFDRYYGSSISPENFLYYSTLDSLWQMDLAAPNPLLTKTLVYADQNGNVCMGQHQLGPDGKIYITNAMPCGFPSTITDSLNTNLIVIDQPDSSGLACNILPYFQAIGGIRSYLGLPNFPNYELLALTGSFCDTLTEMNEDETSNVELCINPNPTADYVTIQFKNLPIQKYTQNIIIRNILGETLLTKKLDDIKFTLDVTDFPTGLYTAQVLLENRVYIRKFIVL